MGAKNVPGFIQGRGWELPPGAQVVVNLPKNPRTPLCGAADHDRLSASVLQDFLGLVRRVDIAIANNGDMAVCYDLGDGVIFGLAAKATGAGAAMNGQCLNARVFGDAGNTQSVFVFWAPASTNLQCHRYGYGGDYAVENLGDQSFILQQGRAGSFFTYLFSWTTHIDIDNFSSLRHIHLCRLGHHDGI